MKEKTQEKRIRKC